MGDHHEARMFHDQTYLTSGWHVGMCIMAKNGDPHELESVWSDRLVSSPNPSYQVKLGEGPSSIGNQWAGFTLVHYAVWRYYNNQTGADSAARGTGLCPRYTTTSSTGLSPSSRRWAPSSPAAT